MTVREQRSSVAMRDRLHEAAVRLFATNGISDTSLQAVADEVGVTKAAVYYHYRTKDDLVLGVVEPFVDRLAQVVWSAGLISGRRSQVELVVAGVVDIVVHARQLYLVVAADRAYHRLQQQHPRLVALQEDLFAVLLGPDPDVEVRVAVRLFLAGLTGPLGDPACADMPNHELRELLVGMGHRLLLARGASPRRVERPASRRPATALPAGVVVATLPDARAGRDHRA